MFCLNINKSYLTSANPIFWFRRFSGISSYKNAWPFNAKEEICILCQIWLKCRRCCSSYNGMFCSKFRWPTKFDVTKHSASNIVFKETKSSFSQLTIKRKHCEFFNEFNLHWNAWLWLIVYLHEWFSILCFPHLSSENWKILALFTAVLVTVATKYLRELRESLFWSFWLPSKSTLQFHI